MHASLAVFLASSVFLGGWYVLTHRVEVPAVGGEYTEGLIGEPQFVNPLYASSSDVDSDITRLVFSGLFTWTPHLGIVPDLAESYTVSEDQKTYTVRLLPNARWHNGTPVRASDVVFTIQSIQNPAYRSPLAVSFRGVVVSEVDELTVQFTLEEPFAPFLSTLTVGILPAELWQDVGPKNAALASQNLEPVGSGPYRFEKFSVDKKGNVRSYSLRRNGGYYRHPPLIERITFKFYPDADAAVAALGNRNIEGISFVPSTLVSEVEKDRRVRILRPSMPLTTVLFFNQEVQPILKDLNIRKAFALSLDKQAIVDQALAGYGTVIQAPILPGSIGEYPEVATINTDLAAAGTLLDATEYKLTEGSTTRAKATTTKKDGEDVEQTETLAIALTTVDRPEFIAAAEAIKAQAAQVGFDIEVNVVPSSSFYENVIKPRAFQMLLTGTQLGIDPDPYPFWHSSQTIDPGLNLATYTNRKADTLLEEARGTADQTVRAEKYRAFQDILAEDLPAIFLFQSSYTYAIASKIQNVSIDRIFIPADRFVNVTQWYIKTKKIIQ